MSIKVKFKKWFGFPQAVDISTWIEDIDKEETMDVKKKPSNKKAPIKKAPVKKKAPAKKKSGGSGSSTHKVK